MNHFSPKWYTVEPFHKLTPICLFHKEQETCVGNNLLQENQKITNLHVLARADLELHKKTKVILQISADDYYKLYINGIFVSQGPAPAYPADYFYQEFDISEYLIEGKNVFAVHLYYQGLVNRVWNSGDQRFGIGTRIIFDEEETELHWRYRITAAYQGTVTGYDTQFLENFDSNKWDENWASVTYEEKGYRPMVVANWADYTFHLQPTKQLKLYKKVPFTCETTDEGLFVDFGEELTGSLEIVAEGEKGQQIRICCGEELLEPKKVRYEMRCNCTYEETWILSGGSCRLEQYDYKAFRYVNLFYDDKVTIKELYAVVRHYPLEEEWCTFTCSDKQLERIFQICKNAVKYGTQEGYLDCPSREKGQYLGDAVVTAHAQILLTGTTEMLRKCIRQFADTDQICKGLMAVAPGSLMQEIADFSLLWSELLLLDYQYTKDKAFLQKYYPVAKKVLYHFQQYEGEMGMLRQVADKWNLVDWPENLRDGYDFELFRPVVADGYHNVINALYIGAMKTLAQIEHILSLPQSFDWENYKAAFIKMFYEEDTGLFCDAKGSSHCSLHANIYPVYFGFLDERKNDVIVKFFLEKGLKCGVFVSYFLLKGMARSGYKKEAYHLIINESEQGWVNMLREGATTCFEAWGKDQKWNTSLLHPWASAPIPLIIEDLTEVLECFTLTIPYQGKQYRIEKKEKENIQYSIQNEHLW